MGRRRGRDEDEHEGEVGSIVSSLVSIPSSASALASAQRRFFPSRQRSADVHPQLGAWIPELVLAHVLSAFAFALLHGPSVIALFMLRTERELPKVQTLLHLSRRSSELSWGAWSLLAITGLLLAATEHTWRHPWLWGSIVVLVLISGLMSALAARPFNQARSAAGLPWFDGKRMRAPGPVVRAELDAALSRIRARVPALVVIGVGGFAILVWLMTARPS